MTLNRQQSSKQSSVPFEQSEEMLQILADYMMVSFNGALDQQPGDFRTILLEAAPLYHELEALAQRPDAWRSLPPERLRLLAFEQILHYAFTGDKERVGPLAAFYGLLVELLPATERKALEQDVSGVLDSQAGQLNALMPFLFHDPDPFVVSTASLDYAMLMPLRDNDPMTGPKACLEIIDNFTDNDEPMAAGILAGVLLLGDRRTLPLLEGRWHRLSHDGQAILRLAARSGNIYASMIEFYLQWLESVDEDSFGIPAGALAQLPGNAVFHPVVRDLERSFPAPYNLLREEYEAHPPAKVLQEWTLEEYGRMIEPRLSSLAAHETHDKVIPWVMRDWGLITAEEAEEQLASDSIDVEAIQLAADAFARTTVEEAKRSLPKDQVLARLNDIWLDLMADTLAEYMAERTMPNAPVTARLAAEKDQTIARAKALLRLLKEEFGWTPESIEGMRPEQV